MRHRAREHLTPNDECAEAIGRGGDVILVCGADRGDGVVAEAGEGSDGAGMNAHGANGVGRILFERDDVVTTRRCDRWSNAVSRSAGGENIVAEWRGFAPHMSNMNLATLVRRQNVRRAVPCE